MGTAGRGNRTAECPRKKDNLKSSEQGRVADERQGRDVRRASNPFAVAAAIVLAGACAGSPLFAATNYVASLGAHEWPYDTWETAATDIQSAVDAATDGDTVLVTDGVYAVTAQIEIAGGIEVRSVNGAAATTVGRVGPEAHRLFYLSSANACLNGFTLTHGSATGDGGADRYGGGVLMAGGARILNCVVSNNEAAARGGGISFVSASGGLVQNCVIVQNRSGGDGGGLFGSGCTIQDTDFFGNYAGADGGGAHVDGEAFIARCRVASNVAGRAGGGLLARGVAVSNCLIVGNVASNRGGGVGHYVDGPGLYVNCTIVGNGAPVGGGAEDGTFRNTILYGNSAPDGSNYHAGTFSHCCSAPAPDGPGNLSADPQFFAWDSFRLGPSSPCIDAGTNDYETAGTIDLDGAPRIVHGVVDVGAYEYRECLHAISNDGDWVACTWNVMPDEAYRFERSTDLQPTNWVPVFETSGEESASVEFSDYNPAGIGFYRAVYLPPD